MQKIYYVTILVIAVQVCYCQKVKDPLKFAPLHLGFTQGIGTNGVSDLSYINNVSLNLISGQSWGNNILCISGVSHFQVMKSQGIYLSGISNTSGGFPYTRRSEKDSLATINAIQIAGVVNIVNGGGNGAQISGLSNLVKESFDGLQFSTLYNSTGKGFSGAQLGLLINEIGEYGIGAQTGFLLNTSKNMSGLQLFGLFNSVVNDLDGIQIGGFNYVGNRKSTVYRNLKMYWLQMGLINYARQNSDGMQVGLVNYGGDVGFSQIGLINISKKIPQYPIGFLNISGDAEFFLRYSRTRIFPHNIEVGTGSKKLINTIGYSFDQSRNLRAFSYSLGNQLKGGNRNNEYFFEYNLMLTQVKEENQSFVDPNLVYSARIQIGYNPFLQTKLPWMFFYVGCSANHRNTSDNTRLVDGSLSSFSGNHERWLDFHFGIQID